MPLRNQPYLPLYVQDFLTDEKLIECSAQATGVYIRLMCIMHKSEPYGTILLKQKDKQNDKQTLNFACKLAKHLPYDLNVIESSLDELISEGVLILEGEKLYQRRMVKDNHISEERSKAGSRGGIIAQAKVKAKVKANIEYEIEDENIDNNKGGLRGDLYFQKISELETELLSSEEWINVTAKRHGITSDEVKTYIPTYCLDQEAKENTGLHLRQYKEHFVNWLGKQLEKDKPKVNHKDLTHDELSDLAAKRMANFSDYQLLQNGLWRKKVRK